MAKNTKFKKQVNRWLVNLDKDIKGFGKIVALKVLTRVVNRTPVDTGRARASWNIVAGTAADTSVQPETYTGGRGAATTAAVSRGASVQLDHAYVVSNNLPYIRTLEHGGYPKNPKKGSWDRKEKRYRIKSAGGFSKQAPAGMVALAIADTRVELASLQRGGGGGRV